MKENSLPNKVNLNKKIKNTYAMEAYLLNKIAFNNYLN
jgi:hypothetical protein